MDYDPLAMSENEKRELQKLCEKIPVTESLTNRLPYLVAEGVSLELYNAFLHFHEDHFRYDWERVGGRVWIIEQADAVHAGSSARFLDAIRCVVGNTLCAGGASTFNANGLAIEADQCWSVEEQVPPSEEHDSSSSASSSSHITEKLTFVLEVGHIESADHLRAKAAMWLDGTTANEVVLLKINPDDKHDLNAEIWRRDTYRTPAQPNPIVQHIEFGHCTAVGQCELEISLAAIYDAAANIPPQLQPLNGVMRIDLHPIKRTIRRGMREMRRENEKINS